ncbi:MAG: CDP-glycerol glycerophosphotransferase family protein [Lachnospiraceae bacterium]|nr:CDP-glycerol glycerophosphotransferase family protein [Lachnospiraceae bacterium]
MIFRVLKRKAKRIYPAAVEGKFFHRIGVAWKQMAAAVDRSIGYQNRKHLSKTTAVVPNRILFITFNHSYSCNPKYICEELIRRNADVDIWWGVTNLISRGAVPDLPNVHVVKMNSFEYFQIAVSAKVIVINSLLGDKFYPFPTKPEQIVYETWHGSLGIKRFDPAHYNTNVSWPEAAKRTGKLTTFCISNSQFEEDVFRETFWKETPILRLGHARNDVFFDTYKKQRRRWRDKFIRDYALSEDDKFILYAPTFRDTHNFAVYDLQPERLLAAMEKRFGGEWKLLLRYHDNDRKNERNKNTVVSPNVIDVTQFADIQELLSFVDAGITDYSSWIYDFVLSKRPGFIYARDIDLYNNERGFYFRLESTPFPVARNNDEMEKNVLAFDNDTFIKKCDDFLAEKQCIDDGHSSERIADHILSQIGKSNG